MHHNTRMLLTELPVDIIGEIYDALSQLDRPHYITSSDNFRADLGWIRLTHVGHYLRDVGLNIPSLWARELDVFPKAFDTFLARSKNALLYLHIDKHGPCHTQIMLHLSKLIPRSKIISGVLYDHSEETGNESRQLASQLVEALCKNDLPNARHIDLGIRVREFAMPTSGFTAPSLKHLGLYGTFLPFTAPNLLHLRMERCRSLDIKTVIDLLRTLSQLETLSLARCDLSAVGGALVPVFLPKLACFEIGGQQPILLTLARYILFPPLQASSPTWVIPPCIQIEKATNENDLYDGFACLSSRLPSVVAAPTALTFPMEMAPMPGMITSMRVFLSADWDSSKILVPSPHMIFESFPDWRDSHHSVPVFLAGLAKLFASSVRAIHFLGGISRPENMFNLTQYHPAGDREEFCNPLRHFRSVTELHLGSAAGGLPELMHGGNPSNDVAFPALKTIYINVSRATGYPVSHDTIFYRTRTEVEVQHLEEPWWTAFVAMLVGRAAQGHGIHRLVLQGRMCHIIIKEDGAEGQSTRLKELDLEDVRRLVEEVVDERDNACDGASTVNNGGSET